MRLVLADLSQDALDRGAAQLSGTELVTVPTDVSKIDQVNRLKDRALCRLWCGRRADEQRRHFARRRPL